MSRITYKELADAAPETAAMLADRLPLNLYRGMLHAGPAFMGLLRFSEGLQQHTLTKRLRELVILRIAFLTGSRYEIHQHRTVAALLGITEAEIAAVEAGDDLSHFDQREQDLLRFVGDVNENVRASDQSFEAVRRHFDERQLVEIVLLAGYYGMLARFLETFDIEPEPDGVIPRDSYAGRIARWKAG